MKISRSAKTAATVRPERRRRRSLPALEWVEDAAGQCARATVVGSRSLLVENHTGILSFSDERVRLNTARGPLCVSGSDLTLRDVRPGALIVRGSISRVELPCVGGDAPDEG
ncbi:MAG: YabP/YqfC family sporulation protein [Clostridia bacterium]|nr:YabP/YqfC family sporulation protein [Clostridia bacterium]